MEEKPIIKKPLIGTIIKYLRDFSIVVAGIAVTLYVNDRITNQSEKRDLKLYLNAIKLELQENVRDINDVITSMQGSIGYANYLRAHDKKTLNADTIMSYAENGYYLIQTMTYKTNAFANFGKKTYLAKVRVDRQSGQDVTVLYRDGFLQYTV